MQRSFNLMAACLCAVAVSLAMPLASAADKIHVERVADLPRFEYPVEGSVTDLVTNKAAYEAFAKRRRADLQSIFDGYQIDDKSTVRDLLSEAAAIDFLLGDYDTAAKEALMVRDLQEKPSAKILSGNELVAFSAAAKATGSTDSDAFHRDALARVEASLKPMPFATVEESIKELDAGKMLAGEGLIMGRVHENLQPVVDKYHSLSSDLAGIISGARYALTVALPMAKPLAKIYGDYLAANEVIKPDIWAARDVTLAPGKYKTVNVGIWDSGVDSKVYPGQILTSHGKQQFIAFDLNAYPDRHPLYPLTPDAADDLPHQQTMMQGFSDLRSHINSPEATQVQQLISTLKPDEVKKTVETLGEVGDYSHGTHVAGIAVAGNPYARIALARISFDWKTIPDPCPSEALTRRSAKSYQADVDFFRANHVRVVNMSWGGDVKGYETSLEKCGIGKDADERKVMARKLFDIESDGLTKAMASAPGILFVAAAGNSDQDPSFIEDIPAGIRLPNLLVVGAVDQAGDEASFTSYGPTVVVDANGYQVKSHIPGGKLMAESGTSMAAPQVTNLAGKLFAVDPKLTPAEAIELIESTATATEDKRRHLIDPKAALAKLTAASGAVPAQ